MMVLMMLLAGCAGSQDPADEPLPEPETFPFGLDPEDCVVGSVGVGDWQADYSMTMEQAERYKCFSELLISAGEDVGLPELEVTYDFLVVRSESEVISVSLPSARTVGSMQFIGPMDRISIPLLTNVGGVVLFDTQLDDLSDFAGIEVMTQLVVNGDVGGLDGLRLTDTFLVLVERDEPPVGFENFTALQLVVSGSQMDSLRGLDNVVTLRQADFYSSELGSLEGLDGVRSSGSMTFSEVAALTSMQGMQSLESIAGSLTLMELDDLASLDFPALEDVAGDLVVEDTAIGTIDLPALVTVGGDIVFRNNSALPSCAVQQLVDRLTQAGFAGQVENVGNDDSGVCADEST